MSKRRVKTKNPCDDYQGGREIMSVCTHCGHWRCQHDLMALRLSELCKRQQVRAYAMRDTVITRSYRKKLVYRNIKEGTELCGGHAFTKDGQTIVHVESGRIHLPMDYWYLPSKDFRWFAEVNVINDISEPLG